MPAQPLMALSSYSSFFFFVPDICVVKVTGRDWLRDGEEGSGDGQITQDRHKDGQTLGAAKFAKSEWSQKC